MSPKGQITLPVEIRRELGIAPRDTVEIVLVDGAVRVRPASSRLDEHHQIAGPLSPRRDWKEVEAIAREESARSAASEGLDRP